MSEIMASLGMCAKMWPPLASLDLPFDFGGLICPTILLQMAEIDTNHCA